MFQQWHRSKLFEYYYWNIYYTRKCFINNIENKEDADGGFQWTSRRRWNRKYDETTFSIEIVETLKRKNTLYRMSIKSITTYWEVQGHKPKRFINVTQDGQPSPCRSRPWSTVRPRHQESTQRVLHYPFPRGNGPSRRPLCLSTQVRTKGLQWSTDNNISN